MDFSQRSKDNNNQKKKDSTPKGESTKESVKDQSERTQMINVCMTKNNDV